MFKLPKSCEVSVGVQYMQSNAHMETYENDNEVVLLFS